MTLAETSGAQAESTWEEQGGGWRGRQAEDSLGQCDKATDAKLPRPRHTHTDQHGGGEMKNVQQPPPLGTPTERAPTPLRCTIEMKTTGSKKRKKKKNAISSETKKQTR
ncbi:hypothetical protein HETIRDRAFT_447836 [Heterobasidion irregulare TC 32-1]|uniref:Uncharacterized protein n=1 Tax=Heterobasidion irregulare (strain TC 32-1) TaxID=747525 RepID=W4KQI2_HETIT|nr:uncharacterized protein HETIRDRAFT_447836 [Heterobasidion irregulare TC 32-1]ETW87291.1 hypothetical protein HETIRDRAFT_447836 [Heterobasidion irregulare TC 32-1]